MRNRILSFVIVLIIPITIGALGAILFSNMGSTYTYARDVDTATPLPNWAGVVGRPNVQVTLPPQQNEDVVEVIVELPVSNENPNEGYNEVVINLPSDGNGAIATIEVTEAISLNPLSVPPGPDVCRLDEDGHSPTAEEIEACKDWLKSHNEGKNIGQDFESCKLSKSNPPGSGCATCEFIWGQCTVPPTATATATETATPTSTFTYTPSPTLTETPTPTFTASATPTFTASPTASPTASATATATSTASPTASNTSKPPAQPEQKVEVVFEPSATPSSTPLPTAQYCYPSAFLKENRVDGHWQIELWDDNTWELVRIYRDDKRHLRNPTVSADRCKWGADSLDVDTGEWTARFYDFDFNFLSEVVEVKNPEFAEGDYVFVTRQQELGIVRTDRMGNGLKSAKPWGYGTYSHVLYDNRRALFVVAYTDQSGHLSFAWNQGSLNTNFVCNRPEWSPDGSAVYCSNGEGLQAFTFGLTTANAGIVRPFVAVAIDSSNSGQAAFMSINSTEVGFLNPVATSRSVTILYQVVDKPAFGFGSDWEAGRVVPDLSDFWTWVEAQ
jgi:hypothetical protein